MVSPFGLVSSIVRPSARKWTVSAMLVAWSPDAFDVLGNEEQMGGGPDVPRIFHHVGQQLAEQRGVEIVDLFVAAPGRQRQGGVLLDIGVEHILHDLLGELAHARDRGDRAQRPELVQLQRALGDVLRIIADALDIGGNLDRRDRLRADRWPSAAAVRGCARRDCSPHAPLCRCADRSRSPWSPIPSRGGRARRSPAPTAPPARPPIWAISCTRRRSSTSKLFTV